MSEEKEKLLSSKELFLRYVDPEHNSAEEPVQMTREQRIELDNKLIELSNQEFLKRTSDNVLNAINLRQEKDK